MKSFVELDTSSFAESVVILDIDGTLTADGLEPSPEAMEKVGELALVADVLLCSNGRRDRTKKIASNLNVAFIHTSHNKPSRRVVEELMLDDRKVFVIGDKLLTDGLFASNINAIFVPVKRITGGEDLFTRIIYGVDNILMKVLKPLLPMAPFISLLRPAQWLKNVLVFSPIFFALEIFDFRLIGEALVAFVTFCFVSSTMYIVNDIRDIDQDKLHPVKRFRPLASSTVTLRGAYRMIFLLAVISIVLLSFLSRIAPMIGLYVIVNLFYSYRLKHVAVLDMVLVSSFYVMRVIAGGMATRTYLSPWIISCVFFGAMFLIIGKRRSELAHQSKRKVLANYSKTALDFLLVASATLVITSYGLYSILAGKSTLLVYSTGFVVVVIFRLLNSMYISESHAEYPETLIFKDRTSLIVTISWALFMFAILYH